jgi:hypothetical protein
MSLTSSEIKFTFTPGINKLPNIFQLADCIQKQKNIYNWEI